MTRYPLKLEAIGDNHQAYFRDFDRNILTARKQVSYQAVSWRLLQAAKLGYTKPWVARITGTDSQYGLAREFLRAEKDYTSANGTGSRGIILYYWLEPGIYEVNERLSWKNHRRYFLHVHDSTTAIEITKEQVLEWLQQKTSEHLESTS